MDGGNSFFRDSMRREKELDMKGIYFLDCGTSGSIARYEGDRYHRKTDKAPGNPWIICTLWLAKWYIALGDLDRALELISWVANCSLQTGIMPEQIRPLTGEPLSVAPLTWSHSEFIDTITAYVRKSRFKESSR